MSFTLYQTTQKPTVKGGPGFNTWFNRAGDNVDAWINIMAIADMRFPAHNGNPERRFLSRSTFDDNTGLPLEIPVSCKLVSMSGQ